MKLARTLFHPLVPQLHSLSSSFSLLRVPFGEAVRSRVTSLLAVEAEVFLDASLFLLRHQNAA